ncbi:MAG: outer membrane protein assembly factor BamE [Sulfuricella sp.]|nr:outer membrane protein assembly factor BamE [Sulfuricella sp.]
MAYLRILLLLTLGALAGCSVSPYKLDIQQGNVVTQEMVAKLKPGMTKSQVRFIMGTPLITDAFHADRWDYVYRYQKAGTLTEERQVALYFEGENLKRVSGDVVAASGSEPMQLAPKVEPEEKGFFGKMLEKIGL